VRIHETVDYAYDLSERRDPYTQLPSGWTFTVFRLRPIEQVLSRGTASTRALAVRKAKKAISKLAKNQNQTAA
jgi:hypothetical protein